MELLERSAFVEALRGYLREAAAGEGRLVFVAGEAGIGKTAPIERFCQAARPLARAAIASCDVLSTPGPLGPLIRIAPALGLPGLVKARRGEPALASLDEALALAERTGELLGATLPPTVAFDREALFHRFRSGWTP